jgi:signal transduction histidine kinase
MKIWKTLSDLIIPSQIANAPVENRKALMLTWTHFLLFVALIATALTDCILNGGIVSNLTYTGFLATFSSFFIFKKWRNIIFSGNYIASAWFIFVAVQVYETGGVFSENVAWLIGSPVIAFIFMNMRWGWVWMFIIHIFFTYIFIKGKYEPAFNIRANSDDYFFVSYTMLSFFVFGFAYVFEKSQSKILLQLNEKNQILEEQKKEISAHTEALKLKDEKLQKSNADLQNFAYSASHDLKEPLRMIGMYTQLLQRRIKPTLDECSEEYMFYMTDGVKRMQKLLDDLLLYSRLGKNENDIQDVDVNQTLLVVIYNLAATIKETNAAIISSNLPTICASSTEMMQLFQNMIANAIKFRRADVAPEVMILHAENEKEHTITLQDNGIGIKEEFKEKVFNIFTKLHSTSQYEGSGIGLATCKKIVEEMGGRMWLTSTEGVGTTFYFTFPKNKMKKKTEQTESIKQEDLVAMN